MPESPAIDAKALGKSLAAYAHPSSYRSYLEVAATVIPFVLLWTVIAVGLQHGHLLVLLLTLPAAGLLLRLFVIQHDCGHGALFKKSRSNDILGHCLGALTLTPYSVWKDAHAKHHATSGNLDKRGVGDVDTFTVAEYYALPAWRRLFYQIYRHPAVMFGIGPAYLFFLRHRLPIGQMTDGWRPWASAMLTNLAIAVLLVGLSSLFSVGVVLAVFVPIVLLAASFGVWLFFVQHQFEQTHWTKNDAWTYHTAALHGSSYYALPPLLHWFSGNIGYHHIHHLVSRIPFYRLPRVMRDFPQLSSIGQVSVGMSLRGIKLALWDEEKQTMVSFRKAAQKTAG